MNADVSLPQEVPLMVHHKSHKLPGLDSSSRFEIVCDIIISLAISALALYVSPMAYGIGIVGTVVSGVTAISRFVDWVGQHPEWREEFYYPLLGEVLSGAALVTTLICGVKLAAEMTNTKLLPALFCTLAGYYAPPTLYHRIHPFFRKDHFTGQ